MIYFKVGMAIGAGILLLIITLLFKRKYFLGILIIEALCSIYLSYYIFYYIGSYNSIPDDIMLTENLSKLEEGLFSLDIDIIWDKKPEIFGFDGGQDLLIIRYSTEDVHIISSNLGYGDTEEGKCRITLSKGYEYAKIKKNQRETYYNIKDGEDFKVNMVLKSLKEGANIRVFYLHDYKPPLDCSSFWEIYHDVRLKNILD